MLESYIFMQISAKYLPKDQKQHNCVYLVSGLVVLQKTVFSH